MEKFSNLFKTKKPVIGMIHLAALPGTPRNKLTIKEIMKGAAREAEIYRKAKIDAVIIENMNDIPYLNKIIGPEILTSMSIAGYEVKNKLRGIPCGIQILAGANKEAIAVAQAANLDFIRAEGFVFAHVADEGIIEACAGELLRYRKNIQAENIMIFADIKKKHSSHSITADTDISQTAHAAEFFLTDGVIVTGIATGAEADIEEIKKVKFTCRVPVLVGSGINIENVLKYLEFSDGIIVGSHFKKDEDWRNELNERKLHAFLKKANR